MSPEVERLAADSGALIAVTGYAVPGDRFTALFLQFKAGTLKLVCDDNTDELIASVIDGAVSHQGVSHDALIDLAGLTIDYAWELRNHRGYVDGFQLRLRDGHGREETRQFEVGASAMDVRRVVR
jgi:hypothetical protein